MEKNVFVIMPFSDECFEMYESIKLKLGEYFNFSNAADEDNQQSILKDIINPIYDADVIIADLTGLNSNVMYELGIAHSLGKKTIVITKDDLDVLPFDLKIYRARQYDLSYKTFDELISYLKQKIDGVFDDSVEFGNPVIDILKDRGIDNISYSNQRKNVLDSDDEKGFLDFLADIEENTDNITNEINDMSHDIDILNEGITSCTNKINNSKSTAGSGTAAFIRKQSRVIAKYINDFESKMKNHNVSFEKNWDQIESDTIGLIENEFASNDDNKNSLITYLNSLKQLKENAIICQNGVNEISSVLDGLVGLQKSITQAVKFLLQDLKNYSLFVDRMVNDIDNILKKSRYFVGEI